jgi:TonB family protein
VGSDGVPRDVRIARSSGHQDLDEAARKALWDWRFEPALEKGVAVPRWVKLSFEFRP